LGRAIRYIFFALCGAKKDAASIPNAAFKLRVSKITKQEKVIKGFLKPKIFDSF